MLDVVFGIWSKGDRILFVFLKYFGLFMLMKLKLFLFIFFCYLILLGDGYDEIFVLSFVEDL